MNDGILLSNYSRALGLLSALMAVKPSADHVECLHTIKVTAELATEANALLLPVREVLLSRLADLKVAIRERDETMRQLEVAEKPVAAAPLTDAFLDKLEGLKTPDTAHEAAEAITRVMQAGIQFTVELEQKLHQATCALARAQEALQHIASCPWPTNPECASDLQDVAQSAIDAIKREWCTKGK